VVAAGVGYTRVLILLPGLSWWDVRSDEHDPISRGYICPKATALAGLHHDPDRLKRPLVKRDGEFVEVSWREAHRPPYARRPERAQATPKRSGTARWPTAGLMKSNPLARAGSGLAGPGRAG